jgi:hypothetical protein
MDNNYLGLKSDSLAGINCPGLKAGAKQNAVIKALAQN